MNTKRRHSVPVGRPAAPSGAMDGERDRAALLDRLHALTRDVMEEYNVAEEEGYEEEIPLSFVLLNYTWKDGTTQWSCGYQFYLNDVGYWAVHDDGGTPLRAAQRLLERLEGKGLCTR